VAATIIAEACAALTERNYDALRAYAGIAPITKQSGKHRTVLMRYVCNGRLRHALYHCARVAVMRDLPSKTYYTAQIARAVILMAAPCTQSPIDYCASWSQCSRLEPSWIAQRHDRRRSLTFQRKLHEPLDRGWGVLGLSPNLEAEGKRCGEGGCANKDFGTRSCVVSADAGQDFFPWPRTRRGKPPLRSAKMWKVFRRGVAAGPC
jgi:hypothetical protein